jgi:hypothetical protein
VPVKQLRVGRQRFGGEFWKTWAGIAHVITQPLG